MTPRLKDRYRNEVAPALQKQFGYSSSMAIPKIAFVSYARIQDDRPRMRRAYRQMTELSIMGRTNALITRRMPKTCVPNMRSHSLTSVSRMLTMPPFLR